MAPPTAAPWAMGESMATPTPAAAMAVPINNPSKRLPGQALEISPGLAWRTSTWGCWPGGTLDFKSNTWWGILSISALEEIRLNVGSYEPFLSGPRAQPEQTIIFAKTKNSAGSLQVRDWLVLPGLVIFGSPHPVWQFWSFRRLRQWPPGQCGRRRVIEGGKTVIMVYMVFSALHE
jgi:hypothetical protein